MWGFHSGMCLNCAARYSRSGQGFRCCVQERSGERSSLSSDKMTRSHNPKQEVANSRADRSVRLNARPDLASQGFARVSPGTGKVKAALENDAAWSHTHTHTKEISIQIHLVGTSQSRLGSRLRLRPQSACRARLYHSVQQLPSATQPILLLPTDLVKLGAFEGACHRRCTYAQR